jgi:16S rRNA processing protein RimM
MLKEELVVGFIRGPHGFEGECKVESSSGEYEHIAKLEQVTLRHGDQTKEVKVESASLAHNTVYLKFKGIDSDEAVKKFNRWELVVPRKYAKPLKKDEWYITDLQNCSLVWNGDPALSDAPAAEEVVGTITDVLEGGAGYLLEVSLSESCTCISDDIKFTASGKTRTVLIPFNNEHVGKVDVVNGTVQLMHLWILE